jgi:hypothetical protein
MTKTGEITKSPLNRAGGFLKIGGWQKSGKIVDRLLEKSPEISGRYVSYLDGS